MRQSTSVRTTCIRSTCRPAREKDLESRRKGGCSALRFRWLEGGDGGDDGYGFDAPRFGSSDGWWRHLVSVSLESLGVHRLGGRHSPVVSVNAVEAVEGFGPKQLAGVNGAEAGTSRLEE